MANALTDFSNGLAAAVEAAGASTLTVDARKRYPASGIAFAEDLVLTADHVVTREEDIKVVLPDGRSLSAAIAGRDPGSDLAVLTGTDSYLQLAMRNMAAGCITAPANVLSPDLREVWDALREGRDAAEAQERVKRQREVLEKYPPFPPTLKALLHRLHGLPRWAVKPPLEAPSQELEEQAVQELAGLKV